MAEDIIASNELLDQKFVKMREEMRAYRFKAISVFYFRKQSFSIC